MLFLSDFFLVRKLCLTLWAVRTGSRLNCWEINLIFRGERWTDYPSTAKYSIMFGSRFSSTRDCPAEYFP